MALLFWGRREKGHDEEGVRLRLELGTKQRMRLFPVPVDELCHTKL